MDLGAARQYSSSCPHPVASVERRSLERRLGHGWNSRSTSTSLRHFRGVHCGHQALAADVRGQSLGILPLLDGGHERSSRFGSDPRRTPWVAPLDTRSASGPVRCLESVGGEGVTTKVVRSRDGTERTDRLRREAVAECWTPFGALASTSNWCQWTLGAWRLRAGVADQPKSWRVRPRGRTRAIESCPAVRISSRMVVTDGMMSSDGPGTGRATSCWYNSNGGPHGKGQAWRPDDACARGDPRRAEGAPNRVSSGSEPSCGSIGRFCRTTELS